MIASFDRGCTFCQPIRLTDDDAEQANPRIAVIALPTGTWSVAVAFESAGQVVVAWDSETARYDVPAADLCAQFEAIGPAVISNRQYVRFGPATGVADQPALCQASSPAFGHFHLAWREEDDVGATAVWYAHDILGVGGAAWSVDAPRRLDPPDPFSGSSEPAIACDIATDPDPITGSTTLDRSAPNVLFKELRATDETRIVGLRSVNSGRTFSPDGTPPDAPAAAVSDPPAGPAQPIGRPATDAATSSLATTTPAWIFAAYEDTRSAPLALRCDARRLATPDVPGPDWSDADADVSVVDRPGDGRPQVGLTFNGPSRALAWIAWQDTRFGASEIAYHGGVLDEAAPTQVDMSTFPYAPTRPLDAAVVGDLQLSACAFDETSHRCVPTRAVGRATEASIDANEVITVAAWTDTRDGNPEIYFKRTDRVVRGQPPRLASGCEPAGGAWIDIELDLLGACPAAGEKIVRYFLYYGTDPGGPFLNAAAPIVVPHDPAAGPTVTRRVTGLVPGTTYQVIVVPEDQARNLDPPSFDPGADLASALANERAIATPTPCVPAACLWRSDVGSLLPHAPPRAAVYLVPPSAQDISLQGPAYACPFATGELEPDARALVNGVPLVLYQVSQPVPTLRLAKAGATILFTF